MVRNTMWSFSEITKCLHMSRSWLFALLMLSTQREVILKLDSLKVKV